MRTLRYSTHRGNCRLLLRFYWDSNCHDTAFPGRLNCDVEQYSNATITWDVPLSEPSGTYRIRHSGYAKTPAGPIEFYTGESSDFEIGSMMF